MSINQNVNKLSAALAAWSKRREERVAPGLLGLALLIAAGADAATLDDVSYTSLPGDRVQVRMKLSAPLEGAPLSFTIDNPARIAIDLPGTTLNLAERTTRIGVGNAESVTAVEADNRSRVVLNLGELVPYEIEANGDTIAVTLEGGPSSLKTQSLPVAPTSAPVATAATPTSTLTMPGSGKGSIRDIDFRRGEMGEARIVVDLTRPDVGVNISQEGDNVVVDFADTQLPENLDRKLDVLDFATPAKEIDTFRQGNGTRMVIKPNGLYEHLAYQSDNTLTVELRPLTKEEEEENKKKKFGYTGERLSLNFQNIEVRAVLQLIADFTEKNLVASDTVGGNVTLRLKNVPWDQALDIILKSRGLDKRDIGNVMMVAPQEEIAAREKLELESQKQIQELAPVRTEFMQVNYAKAGQIAQLLKEEKNKLLSGRGNVTVDERTNTLLVQDTGDKLTEIRNVVKALDIPVRQVLIESRIVIANEDFSKDLGVRFGYSKQGNVKHNAIGANGKSDFVVGIGGGIEGDTRYPTTTTFNTDGLENYIVDLATTGQAANFKTAIGKFGGYLLQLELTAMQQEGRGEVISAPRVITANQHEALIESGTEIPYQQASSSGATAVTFKKAVLSLKVTPQITPDDRLIMDLAVNKDSVGQVFAGVPSIDTNELTTQVLVDDGDTVVLGGIFESENRDDKTSVPWFGDLPYLGRLFKRTEHQANKQELLVFVTPKIIRDTLSLSTP
ncbi:MAG: type IV pilus secretin PilQ [Gammaproteobacteria bacterium]